MYESKKEEDGRPGLAWMSFGFCLLLIFMVGLSRVSEGEAAGVRRFDWSSLFARVSAECWRSQSA